MKKIISIIFCLFLLFPSVNIVNASELKVIDEADLFTPEEQIVLEEKAKILADTHDMDVVILTVWDLDGKSAQDFADDYYDENGYGIGDDFSGTLFLIAMENREWYMSTCGEAIYALTDYGIQSIFSQMAPYLSEDDFYTAFEVYLDELPYYFDSYHNGSPVDGFAGHYDGPGSYSPGYAEEIIYYKDSPSTATQLLISLGIGAVVALIVVLIMRGQMNTAKQQHGAANYLNTNTYQLRIQRDIFLYSRVTRIKKPENNGGGGGSSVHRSSGGRSHGGGGGRF